MAVEYITIPKGFTFHNVSINSKMAVEYITIPKGFTFHNVSINSTITSQSWL